MEKVQLRRNYLACHVRCQNNHKLVILAVLACQSLRCFLWTLYFIAKIENIGGGNKISCPQMNHFYLFQDCEWNCICLFKREEISLKTVYKNSRAFPNKKKGGKLVTSSI